MAYSLTTRIDRLPGVGPKRAKSFEKLGVFTVKDLLYRFPRAYRNKGDVRLISEAEDGYVGSFILTVGEHPRTAMLKGRMTLTKFRAFDESGSCTVTYFNQSYLERAFTLGSEFRFYGKVNRKGRNIELSSPEYEAVYEGKTLPELCPVYSLCEGINQKFMNVCVENALKELLPESCKDPLPPSVLRENSLLPLYDAFLDIHQPKDFASLDRARRRFVFEELFVFAVGVVSAAGKRLLSGAPVLKETDVSELYGKLPFEPTGAQKRTVLEIAKDISDPAGRPMSRLVSGDVGSGKTLCACAAAFMAIRSGYQAALMAPTEILAKQHYEDIAPLLAELGIKTDLLTGSMKAAEKRRAKERLLSGETELIIGTHALISDGVEFNRLGLVITDEQHRFGVMQRAKLSEKTETVHTLVMSATPIPRTLALILYGDLDISAVNEMPPGRQRVDTFTVNESYRERLNGFIRKQVSEGSQVYIVCPSIESEAEDEDIGEVIPFGYGYDSEEASLMPALRSAVEYAEKLKTEVFPELNVGLIHGKLKAAQKDEVMSSFVRGETDILVSTTVIEVGVNVPNATLMVVENAERFGLSQLHQLRGRVGRGKKKAYCILVSDSKSEKAKERLATMHKTYDGYAVALKDLEMRGPGDFLLGSGGTARQSGSAAFKYANLCSDMETLRDAFDRAKAICERDPVLGLPEHSSLREECERFFDTNKNVLN